MYGPDQLWSTVSSHNTGGRLPPSVYTSCRMPASHDASGGLLSDHARGRLPQSHHASRRLPRSHDTWRRLPCAHHAGGWLRAANPGHSALWLYACFGALPSHAGSAGLLPNGVASTLPDAGIHTLSNECDSLSGGHRHTADLGVTPVPTGRDARTDLPTHHRVPSLPPYLGRASLRAHAHARFLPSRDPSADVHSHDPLRARVPRCDGIAGDVRRHPFTAAMWLDKWWPGLCTSNRSGAMRSFIGRLPFGHRV